MIEKEEKLGKEIVEKLNINKGEKINDWSLSDFYNIKKFYYIKIKRINSDKFSLIVLPIDNDGESLLDIRFNVVYDDCSRYNLYFNYLNYYIYNGIYHCFTKFKLTGNYWEGYDLDYWLISRDKRFKWIIEKLKKDNPEYNLAMYELYGFNEEYVRKELGYFKDICK